MRLSHDAPFFLLWFGAAVSLAEMLAGTLLAPMGLVRGLAAIVFGHLIGTTLLVLAGLIGSREGQSAMGTAGAAFGSAGRRLFAALNVVQLVGWTAIMLATGARQFAGLAAQLGAAGPVWPWIAVFGLLIAAWAVFARAGIGRLNTVAVALLIALLLMVFVRLFFVAGDSPAPAPATMGFGAALELVVVMPLSWLPLVADYNRHARSGGAAAVFTWLGYGIGSAWMYAIGLLMALRFGGLDIGALVGGAPAVVAALAVILLSTVTTTFMDTYSAGVSARHIAPIGSPRILALAMTAIGTAVALAVPIAAYESFLYTIGALFSPLYAVVLARYFGLGERADAPGVFNWPAIGVWALGVASYYAFLVLDAPIGATLPAFAFTALLYVLTRRIRAIAHAA
ncbi:putative hydroxymethylpyrimidine transporter CytX [Salinisphaera sp.]|uniref:putative hydroxymethylpyrimidine transporter CytX n=1 Tax=Salinisphaera sp. TaxID=1914330 RepID=UPI002D776CE9|nr:putative hydroxymethylpyrimidine transporter CytX [Salinisphaera sp.]HET7315322.1 putative hydroxymethylpyrimidine transporter CytX [Salinisphaera sp.]